MITSKPKEFIDELMNIMHSGLKLGASYDSIERYNDVARKL
jgi:hypothetical protein